MPLSSFDIAAIRTAEQALVESFEAADPTAWVDFYTDDAIFVAPGSAAIEGRAALLAHARQMTPLSSAHIVAQTTDGDGDIAAALGTATWGERAEGLRGHDKPCPLSHRLAPGSRWAVAHSARTAQR